MADDQVQEVEGTRQEDSPNGGVEEQSNVTEDASVNAGAQGGVSTEENDGNEGNVGNDGNGGVEASTSTEDVSEMESNIDTFLEFTGSTDRQLALQYLLGSDGQLEPAVNLFLSGAPPQQESLLNFTAAARAVANNVESLETWSELLENEGVGTVGYFGLWVSNYEFELYSGFSSSKVASSAA